MRRAFCLRNGVMLCGLFLTPLSLACSHATPRAREIRIESEDRGWASSPNRNSLNRSSLTVSRRGNEYWAGNRQIPADEVNSLVSAVLAPPIETLSLRSLGVTDDWLHKLATEELARYEKERGKLTAGEEGLFLAGFHDRQLVRSSIVGIPPTDTSANVQVTVLFDCGAPLLVTSSSQDGFMVPWVISRSGRNQTTFNADISRAIARIVPEDFMNRNRLDD